MKVYIVTSGEYSDYGIRGVFVDRAAAEEFIKADAGYEPGRVEVWEGYDHLPAREKWYVIEEMNEGSWHPRGVQRREQLHWPWEGPHYVGQKRKAWNYHKWQYGERAWGTDKQAVEKVWTEQHMAQEALEAGL